MTLLTNKASGSANPAVIEVDERNFREEVLERSRTVPVVVDFWAPWCGPCRVLGPVLERAAKESNSGFVLAKINVDNNQRLAQTFRVQGIPAVKAFRDGKVVAQFEGALPESQVRTWLKQLTGTALSPIDQIAEEAGMLESRDPKAAEARYRAALATDPNHAASLLGLGRLLLTNGNSAGEELLGKIPADTPLHARAQAWITLANFMGSAEGSPTELSGQIARDSNDLEARYQLAAHQIRGQQYTDAIGELLAIIARNRLFRNDDARHMLLALFAALGDQNPLVPDGRKKLANLLF